MILAPVTLCWCHEADAAVPVLVVVPADEVPDPRTAVRGCDAQVVHLLQHGRRLQRRTIVRVQYRRPEQALLAEHAAQQLGAQLAAFLFMDLPAHGLAAVDALNQVQVEILAAYRRRQIDDTPRPDLVAVRASGGCLHRARWLAASTATLLIGRMQGTIERRLQSQVTPGLSHPRMQKH